MPSLHTDLKLTGDRVNLAQRLAGLLSMALSLVIMILGFWWGSKSDGPQNDFGWMGGYSNKDAIHASLMLFAVCWAYTNAAVSFRVFEGFEGISHVVVTAVHAAWHVLTIVVIIAGATLLCPILLTLTPLTSNPYPCCSPCGDCAVPRRAEVGSPHYIA